MKNMKMKRLMQCIHLGTDKCNLPKRFIILFSIFCSITSCSNGYAGNLSNLDEDISNEASVSTRTYVPDGLIVNLVFHAYFLSHPKHPELVYGVDHQTMEKYLNELAEYKSEQYFCTIKVVLFNSIDYDNILIDLSTDSGYIASDMFIKEFLYEFSAQLARLGPTFSVDYDSSMSVNEWNAVYQIN